MEVSFDLCHHLEFFLELVGRVELRQVVLFDVVPKPHERSECVLKFFALAERTNRAYRTATLAAVSREELVAFVRVIARVLGERCCPFHLENSADVRCGELYVDLQVLHDNRPTPSAPATVRTTRMR